MTMRDYIDDRLRRMLDDVDPPQDPIPTAPRVMRVSTHIPISDEAIVDYGIGTDEDQRAAHIRLVAAAIKSEEAWRALPWHIRFYRSHIWRVREVRHRLLTAWDVLRGRHECEP